MKKKREKGEKKKKKKKREKMEKEEEEIMAKACTRIQIFFFLISF